MSILHKHYVWWVWYRNPCYRVSYGGHQCIHLSVCPSCPPSIHPPEQSLLLLSNRGRVRDSHHFPQNCRGHSVIKAWGWELGLWHLFTFESLSPDSFTFSEMQKQEEQGQFRGNVGPCHLDMSGDVCTHGKHRSGKLISSSLCLRPPTKQSNKCCNSSHGNNFHWSPLKIKENFPIKLFLISCHLFIYL